MNNWKYKNKEILDISDFPEGTHGFIYMIKNKLTGEYYIGKKVLIFNQKKKLGKKESALLPVTRGRKATTKQIQKESDWKIYYGSSKVLLNQIKNIGEENYDKIILHIVKDKRELTYLETKEQFLNNVLEDSLSFNDNINGKYFNQQNKLDKLDKINGK